MTARAILAGLTIAMSACASRPARTDVVLQWNQQVLVTGGPQIQRTLAMVHVAMFDAVNAIERRYAPYLSLPAPPAGASAEAAAAGAARGVLVRLFPQDEELLSAALARSLTDVPDGTGKTGGVNYGDLVAREIYTARSSDNILAQSVTCDEDRLGVVPFFIVRNKEPARMLHRHDRFVSRLAPLR